MQTNKFETNKFENINYKKKVPATGPYSLCQSYRDLIYKSIAYRQRRYVPNTDKNGNKEKLIPQEYLEYLRGLL